VDLLVTVEIREFIPFGSNLAILDPCLSEEWVQLHEVLQVFLDGCIEIEPRMQAHLVAWLSQGVLWLGIEQVPGEINQSLVVSLSFNGEGVREED
jgi:hypothetical protein